MKKILGLDLGVGSIGWAYILEHEDAVGNAAVQVLGMGSRIVPLSSDETDEFTKGNPVTKNQKRRLKRGLRRGYYRYKLRKTLLRRELERAGLTPDAHLLRALPPLVLYGLRARAATEPLLAAELGRVLLLLNEKRGYKSNRKTEPDEADAKKQSDYLQGIASRSDLLKTRGQTVGQLLHQMLVDGRQIRGLIFTRANYLAEFDQIWETQAQHHPEMLHAKLKQRLRDRIIFMQRPLKSQKSLISNCRYELHHKCIPHSSPLNQVCKVWEMVNAIAVTDKRGRKVGISAAQRQAIAAAALGGYPLVSQTPDLFTAQAATSPPLGGKQSWKAVATALGIGTHGYVADERTNKKGIESSHTVDEVLKALRAANSQRYDLLKFDLQIIDHVDEKTGEITQRIGESYVLEPLYRLWHAIYAIEDDAALVKKLMAEFALDLTTAKALCRINFTKQGYGAKSARAIRKLLPHLQRGLDYSKACDAVGYAHSDSKTRAALDARDLLESLPEIKKGMLRNPVVERILNQMANVVNAILADPSMGRPDEIRIELARELRQNSEQRNRTYQNNNQRERRNAEIADELRQMGFRKITRNLIEKYQLYEETDGISPYTGKKLELSEFLKGNNADVEHIIPKSRLFDDSYMNKTICETAVNRVKGDETAYDFMMAQSDTEFKRFIETVQMLYDKRKISKMKRDYLLMPGDQIPDDFVSRSLKETQYITKEARNLLQDVARDVWVSSGMVTAYLRREWGWDDVLKQVNMPIYEAAGLTYMVERTGGRKETRIREDAWSKRDDHRHHAIDALVTACTRQAYIQRLNHLNAADVTARKNNREESLRTYIQSLRPLTTDKVAAHVARILVSFKPGKRVATLGTNKTNKTHAKATGLPAQRPLTPKGALSEESVYGKVTLRDYVPVRLGPSFTLEQARRIADKTQRKLVMERLLNHGNDPTKAFKGYKNDPIYPAGPDGAPLLEVMLIAEREEYVIRYKLDQNFKAKDADSIVDGAVRAAVKARLQECGGDHKAAFKDLDGNPIWINQAKGIAVRTVRCTTGLSKVEPLRYHADGKADAFVKPGNNHHIALYRDTEGKLHENAVTFWEAFERKKLGIPVVVRQPASTWDHLLHKVLPSMDEVSAARVALLMENKLPRPGWEFVVSMEQNEMFVWGMTRAELKEALATRDYKAIALKLYRVQKIASKYYVFRLHSESKVDNKAIGDAKAIEIGKFIRIQSLEAMTGIKVKLSNLGLLEEAAP
jgi:CRISPR-associated endonuclease Csn1